MSRKGEKLPLPTPKTENQKLYLNCMRNSPMTIGSGPAGCGKSYLAATTAGHMLKEKKVNRIVLTRPTVPTGRSIGFFPGTLEEKMDPWCKPILNTLQEYLGKGDFECKLKNKNIEIVPFETIRGRSFEDAFVILDEAQNTTFDEMKAFVTRSGENCTVVINGDVTQSDLKKSDNGLIAVTQIVKNSARLKKWVSLVEFNSNDIVRSGLCQMWVQEFEELDFTWVKATDANPALYRCGP